MELLPSSVIIDDILTNIDFQTLCSVSSVSRSFRFYASQALSSISSLDLTEFSPPAHLLTQIVPRFTKLESITIDCLRLDDDSIPTILGVHLLELKLLKCSSLSSQILVSIGKSCPNLRVLVLELAGSGFPYIFSRKLTDLLQGCSRLESLCIKIRGINLVDAYSFHSIEVHLPQSVKLLKLQPIVVSDAVSLISKLSVTRDYVIDSIPVCPDSSMYGLQCISLVLNVISDELIYTISNSLPLLLKLDLEDRPCFKPIPPRDLTNNGLQSLSSCRHLVSLSLIRSQQNLHVYFKHINSVGFFLLSEGCRNLESLRLGGLKVVSDAGFTSILQSCQNLKKFEVRNALLLSDLALMDSLGGSCSLVELKLSSCGLLTSAFAENINSSSTLEVLDLSGCRSVADACLISVSCINTLNILDLSGADVTDTGLAVLGKGNSPIARLRLRDCKRVTDRGISLLLNGGGPIPKTLSSLDVGCIPGISDKAIQTIAKVGLALSELCVRSCSNVTNASIEAFISESRFQDGGKLLRKLDLYHCSGLSAEVLESLKSPYFRSLQWLGVGLTRLTTIGDNELAELCRGRPCLTLCQEGCEAGCHNGWQFHFYTRGLCCIERIG